MAKEKIPYESFLNSVNDENKQFVSEVHEMFIKNNCTYKIKEAKNGYVTSYVYEPAKRVVANYVFRKKGPMLRIYADHVAEYDSLLDQWPQSMKDTMLKAQHCKRLLDSNDCNGRCLMGFEYLLDGKGQQKCRNNAFMFFLGEETNPYLKEMLEKEMGQRQLDA